MKLAFYAPLKPPHHPVPSGDRTMARSLMTVLTQMGADVTLASDLRSRDGAGATDAQAALIAQAEAALPALIAQGRDAGWQAWITYHNYYKAPDLLGPAVTQALGIPYLQIESTRARKRLTGPWATFAHRAEAACDAADVILYVTQRDAEALRRDAPPTQKLLHLNPFLDRDDLPPQSACTGPMLAVGMLRAGDKAASYAVIAQTLTKLPAQDWQLHIAGDGPARAEIAQMMAPFGDAVTFLGALTPAEVQTQMQSCSLLIWPGVNEAFGLAYLEAQASGLPVVAQDRPGVRDVLAPGPYPAPESGPQALADMLHGLLSDGALRHAKGAAARAHIGAHHLRSAASATLRDALVLCGVPA